MVLFLYFVHQLREFVGNFIEILAKAFIKLSMKVKGSEGCAVPYSSR